MQVKTLILSIFGVVGSSITSMLGGWDVALQTLLIFMVIDYISGFAVAAIFKKSQKTSTGALNSNVGWKGLCRKGMALLIVLVACRLDLMIGANNMIRNTVIIAYIANESISIIENAGLMGLPIPDVIKKSIDALSKKEG